MMTDKQREMFSQLIDLDWDANNTWNTPEERDAAREEATYIRWKLRKEMGPQAYDDFMDKGAKMFASK